MNDQPVIFCDLCSHYFFKGTVDWYLQRREQPSQQAEGSKQCGVRRDAHHLAKAHQQLAGRSLSCFVFVFVHLELTNNCQVVLFFAS